MTGTPNLDLLRAEVARLLALGVEPSRVEDTVIGSSFENAKLYERALYEWSLLPREATEGKAKFRNGAKSPGARRSVSGFRAFITDGALS
jgi:hypothetical protein